MASPTRQHTIEGARVAGVACTVPAAVFELHRLADRWSEGEIDRIVAATGITEVRTAPVGMTTSDLCCEAARRLLPALSIEPSAIDAIVFVSQTPDHTLPATSVLLQHRLGLPTSVLAFDINYGCSGYVYGLFQAGLLVRSGAAKRVLLCVGDTTTQLVGPRDRSVRMVFGDAGSATVVEGGENRAAFAFGTDGSGAEHLCVPAGGFRRPASVETGQEHEDGEGNARSAEHIYMNGVEIMNFALREVPPSIEAAVEAAGWTTADVGAYLLHQANRFMVDYLRRKMRLPAEAVPFSLGRYGNSGPATLPMLLCLEGERLRDEGRLDKLVLSGFGSGLSWATVATSLQDPCLLEVGELA